MIIFQTDSPEIQAAYRDLENIRIEYTAGTPNKICAVYFSSNGLYYPNDPKAFHECIILRNRFEWQKNLLPYACKHIFLRDIKKQWYLDGVNSQINSPKKLLEYLRQETAGFRIVCVGSSAGGFAAILYGCQLNADLIFSFNGQFDLRPLLKESSRNINPLVFDYAKEREDYYCVNPFLKGNRNVFYFNSEQCDIDIQQFQLCDRQFVNKIGFKTKHHGIPFPRCCLPYILGLSGPELLTLSTKKHYPLLFSFHCVGFMRTIRYLIYSEIKRRGSKICSFFRNQPWRFK